MTKLTDKYEKWICSDIHSPRVAEIPADKANYDGILEELKSNTALAKALLGVRDIPRTVKETCNLSSTELRAVCTCALIKVVSTEVKKGVTKPAIYVTEEFCEAMGAKTLDEVVDIANTIASGDRDNLSRTLEPFFRR